jgi:26S proteasome regulatory subunit N13
MYSFGEALQSGQIGPLMQQFDLPSEVSNAATKGDIEEFAKAMQDHMRDMKKTKKSNEDEEKMDTVDDATPRI